MTAPGGPATADPVSDFFCGLAAPGHVATFERESATLRFDAAEPGAARDEHGRSQPGRPGAGQTEHWYLTVSDGSVTVTRQDDPAGAAEPADTVVHISRPDLEAMVTGRLNAQAAVIRGLVTCEGSFAGYVMFQRALPGPPGSAGRVPPISSRDVMAAHSLTPAAPASSRRRA